MAARFLGSFVGDQKLPATRQRKIAFLGRSNVGKSSLINLLTGNQVARVSKTPGRTQALNLFDIDGKCLFGDFPGYGYARVSKEQRKQFESLITNYLTAGYFDLAVQIVDSRHPGLEMDLQLHQWLNDQELPHVIVLNKADKLNQKERVEAEKQASALFPDQQVLFASAYTKEGKQELRRLLGL